MSPAAATAWTSPSQRQAIDAMVAEATGPVSIRRRDELAFVYEERRQDRRPGTRRTAISRTGLVLVADYLEY